MQQSSHDPTGRNVENVATSFRTIVCGKFSESSARCKPIKDEERHARRERLRPQYTMIFRVVHPTRSSIVYTRSYVPRTGGGPIKSYYRERDAPSLRSPRLKRYLTNDENNNICQPRGPASGFSSLPARLFFLADVYNGVSQVLKGLAALMATISRFGHGVRGSASN